MFKNPLYSLISYIKTQILHNIKFYLKGDILKFCDFFTIKSQHTFLSTIFDHVIFLSSGVEYIFSRNIFIRGILSFLSASPSQTFYPWGTTDNRVGRQKT